MEKVYLVLYASRHDKKWTILSTTATTDKRIAELRLELESLEHGSLFHYLAEMDVPSVESLVILQEQAKAAAENLTDKPADFV